jgi:hypothetical protein
MVIQAKLDNAQDIKENYNPSEVICVGELNKLEVGMEVKLRAGEYFRVRIDEINGDELIGLVLTETLYFQHNFGYYDTISFRRENVFDVYDITRWGVLL